MQYKLLRADRGRFFRKPWSDREGPASTKLIDKEPLLERLIDYVRRFPPLARLAELAPGRVYLVGGPIRDLALDRAEPKDIDLAVDGDALALAEELAQDCAGRAVVLSRADATARIVFPGYCLDLTGLRRPGLPADLTARDFTVNALAASLDGLVAGRADLIDPTNGWADLAAGLIRPAGLRSLPDDPLRIMRGFRLAGQLGFRFSPGFPAACRAAGPGLVRVAGERIGRELALLLACPRSGELITLAAEHKLLGFFLSETAALMGLYQNRYHHLDGLGHTLAVLDEVELLLAGPRPDWADQAWPLPPDRAVDVKLAALFHDVGKAIAARPKSTGGLSFYNHAKLSEDLWLQAASRLRFSRIRTRVVGRLVQAHMRPLSLLLNRPPSVRALRRLTLALGDRLTDFGLVCLADARASRGPASSAAFGDELVGLLGRLAEMKRQAGADREEPLVNGRDLTAALGRGPGPWVGAVLEEISEARLAGLVVDRAGALALARRAANRFDQSADPDKTD